MIHIKNVKLPIILIGISQLSICKINLKENIQQR